MRGAALRTPIVFPLKRRCCQKAMEENAAMNNLALPDFTGFHFLYELLISTRRLFKEQKPALSRRAKGSCIRVCQK